MSRKKRKHSTTKNTHLKEKLKREKLLMELKFSMLKQKPKKDEIIYSIGSPINNINDIISCLNHMRTSHQIEIEKKIEIEMIEDWLNNPIDKNHLIWNCIQNENRDIEWFGSFISNKDVQSMKDINDIILEKLN
jgi:hypothetical protein